MSSEGQQAGGQAAERARESAEKAQELLSERASEAKEKAGGQVRSQVEERTTEAGRQVRQLADAVRRGGTELQQDGNAQGHKFAEQAAGAIERLGRYLEESDGDRILDDVERFARKQPWIVGAGAFALGLAASRFLKASSAERYRSTTRGPSYDGRPEDAPMAREQAALPPAEVGP